MRTPFALCLGAVAIAGVSRQQPLKPLSELLCGAWLGNQIWFLKNVLSSKAACRAIGDMMRARAVLFSCVALTAGQAGAACDIRCGQREQHALSRQSGRVPSIRSTVYMLGSI